MYIYIYSHVYIYINIIKLLESWLIGLISGPNDPCSQYLN